MTTTPPQPTRLHALASFELSDADQRLWLTIATISIIAITVVHYLTDSHAVAFHNVYRRLYYIPIVLAAFSSGVKGGVGAAIMASLLYIPHAFIMTHADPSPTIDKLLEMVLYVSIGGLTGWLVNHQNHIHRALLHSLQERDILEESLVRAGKLSALGELTSGLAHEIRNPLASIMGSAEALAAEFDQTHRKYRMSQLLLSEIDRLNRVVSDFLRFARPGELHRQRVEMTALAQQVRELTSARAHQLGVEVEDAGATLSATVMADAGQVRQVLLNFFLNAYQAFEEHPLDAGTNPRIELRTERRTIGARRYICLGVGDNGPGVPRELRDRIFDPYFTTRLEGSGLGLSISSRIAEAHDGFIELADAPAGALFWLCLPEVSP